MNADGYSLENRIFQPNQQTVSNFGVSQSLRYRFSKALLVKASYEYATSLPDETELFGDFTLVHPNPFLNPEQSHNANLGLQYSHKKLKVELNTFYRLTDNIIWLRTSQFFAQYQNLLKALVKGLDAEVQYQPLDFVKLKANITYQDIRNRSPRKVTGSIDDRYYDARLPNIPYLFGNMEVRYQKENFAGTNNSFSAWWSTSYVHEFFLFWAVDGNKDFKNTIPGQFIQNVGVTYSLPADRLSVSLEATNLFNQKHLTISVCKGQETPFTSL
jgi:outer membrane receptor protein involved in Fe transport